MAETSTTGHGSEALEATVQVRLRLPRDLHNELRRRVSASQAPSLDSEVVRVLRGELPPVDSGADRGELLLDDAGDLAGLAAEQGVPPVGDTDTLSGDFWPAEERTEDSLDALREWREEARVPC